MEGRWRWGRGLIAAGVAMALYGGFRLAAGPVPPGAPVPPVPVVALLAGAGLFGLGSRLAPPEIGSPSPDPGPWPRVPREGRRWLAGGVALALLVVLGYGALGYHPVLLFGWVGSWGLATRALWPVRGRRGAGPPLESREVAFLGFVLLVVALLVLPYLDVLPYEISTDEIYSVRAVRRFAAGASGNPFGLVSWWGLPALWFAAVSKIGVLTGTSIGGVRLVTAVTALLIPLPFYVWIRTLHGRTVAAVATVFLAFAHAFLGWGRVALNQNSPVLLLVTALALLSLGVRDRRPVRLLWGGIALGLGFYTYPSGQIALAIWLAALAVWWATAGDRRHPLLPVALFSLLGVALCVGPMLVNAAVDFASVTERARAIAITNPAAIEHLRVEWGLEGGGEIVRENLKRALLGFNAPYPYVTYYNPAHALLDPITGSLVWAGLGMAFAHPGRRGLALAAVGFLLVYATGVATEGAPAHGRLLIAFPFAAALAGAALVRLAGALLPDESRLRSARGGVLAAVAAAVVILNLVAFRGFVRHQMTAGRNDAVTAIGRTLDAGIELAGPLERYFGQAGTWDRRHQVFFYSEQGAPLFRWAEERDWHAWISFFADSALVHRVDDLDAFAPGGPADVRFGFWTRASLFLPTSVWDREAASLRARFPDLEHRTITPNRRVSVVEIRR